MLIEPRALEIEQRNASQVRERERVDRQLRERLVGDRVGLVVEKMHGAIPDLEEVDMAGNDAIVDGETLRWVFFLRRAAVCSSVKPVS
jgi:hypothetical protein